MSRSPSHRSGPGPKEKRFHDALRDLFVGAKVDGQSGYINLMRLKAAYYEHRVGPQLLEDVAKALKDFPDFREELFDKLHAFFSRYPSIRTTRKSCVAFSKVTSQPMQPRLKQLPSSLPGIGLNAAGVDAKGSTSTIGATEVAPGVISASPSFFQKTEPVLVARSSSRLSNIPQHSF